VFLEIVYSIALHGLALLLHESLHIADLLSKESAAELKLLFGNWHVAAGSSSGVAYVQLNTRPCHAFIHGRNFPNTL